MNQVTLTIAGGPTVPMPPMPPAEPENPDLSGLKNMVEDIADEKQQRQPKGTPKILDGTTAGDMLIWDATNGVWKILAAPTGPALLVAGADGIPIWLEAPTVGVAAMTGISMEWLSSVGHGGTGLLVHVGTDVPYWYG
jgi:hypothetical protein